MIPLFPLPLLRAPSAYAISSSLSPWLQSFDHVACAFPTKFDRNVLEGARISGWKWDETVCIKQRAGKGTLAAVAERLGVERRGPAHRALADARLAASVAVVLARAGKWA